MRKIEELIIIIFLLGIIFGIIPMILVVLIIKIPILIIPVLIFDLYFIVKEIIY